MTGIAVPEEKHQMEFPVEEVFYLLAWGMRPHEAPWTPSPKAYPSRLAPVRLNDPFRGEGVETPLLNQSKELAL